MISFIAVVKHNLFIVCISKIQLAEIKPDEKIVFISLRFGPSAASSFCNFIIPKGFKQLLFEK